MWSGEHDPGVDVERRACADLPNRIPQRVDLCHQQIRPAIEQVRGEEERPTWDLIATIIRHGGSMSGFGERRKALRFSALGVLIGLGFTPRGVGASGARGVRPFGGSRLLTVSTSLVAVWIASSACSVVTRASPVS
jgi:hypothetical protein